MKKQPATYWAPTGTDRYGSATYAAPVQIYCRWEDKAELFRDAQAREVTSSAVIYPDRPLELRGQIVQGHTAETNPRAAGAREIRQVGSSPNLRNTQRSHKAWL